MQFSRTACLVPALLLVSMTACAWHSRPYRAAFDPAALLSRRLLLFEPVVFDPESGRAGAVPADLQPHMKAASPEIERVLTAAGMPVRFSNRPVDFIQAQWPGPGRYTQFRYLRPVAHDLAIKADVDFLVLPVIEPALESLMLDFSKNIGNTRQPCLVTGRALQLYVILFDRAGHLLAVSEEFGTYPIWRPGFKRRESMSLEMVEYHEHACRAVPLKDLNPALLFLKIPAALERVL